MFGIDFVKIASVEAAKKYEIVNIPSLVYFRYVPFNVTPRICI